MLKAITDLSRITEAMAITGPIEDYIWEELTDGCEWDSIESIANQLELASCAAGSWSDMIYYCDIEKKLGDSDWREAIGKAVDSYQDCTGESPNFNQNGLGFDLYQVVTFAVDWTAQELASRLRGLERVAVATVAQDSLDSDPDVIAFDTEWEAQDWMYEEIERRVQHCVDHSPYAVSEEERESMFEVEAHLVTITEERL
jgi:hypothetical protein